MRQTISFSNKCDEDVLLLDSNGNEVTHGELKYGPTVWPALSFDSPMRGEMRLIDGDRYDLLKCRNRTQTFTLIDCEFVRQTVLSSFVIHGTVPNTEFKSIDVAFRGVSKWFNRDNSFNVDGRELWHKVNTEEFDILVESPDGPFRLSSHYGFSTESSEDQKLLREVIVFRCIPSKGFLSAERIKNLCYGLSDLFSILLGVRIDIETVQVRDIEDRQHYAYFPTSNWGKYPFRYPKECFADTGRLRGKWKEIINGYFGSPIRNKVWNRLAQMYRYKGFWDFEILSYVSLLDKYVDIKTKGDFVPRVGNDELTKDVADFEDAYGDILPDSVNKLIKRVGKRKASFGDRYHKVVSETNEEIIKIINITPEDFSFIKRIRDCVAHGETPNIDNLNEAFIVSGRILLLLTYYAFIDWGLNDEEYLRCIRGALSKIVMSADVDTQHLDRVLGGVLFVQVSNKDFDDIKEREGWDVVLVCHKEAEMPQFSQNYSMLFKEWHKDLREGNTRVIEQYVASKMESGFTGSVSYISNLYVENELDCVRVHGACIINPSNCFQLYLDPSRTIEV